jgi:hypothetical protein
MPLLNNPHLQATLSSIARAQSNLATDDLVNRAAAVAGGTGTPADASRIATGLATISPLLDAAVNEQAALSNQAVTLQGQVAQLQGQVTQLQNQLSQAHGLVQQTPAPPVVARPPLDANGKPLPPGTYISMGAAVGIGIGALLLGGIGGYVAKGQVDKSAVKKRVAGAKENPLLGEGAAEASQEMAAAPRRRRQSR